MTTRDGQTDGIAISMSHVAFMKCRRAIKLTTPAKCFEPIIMWIKIIKKTKVKNIIIIMLYKARVSQCQWLNITTRVSIHLSSLLVDNFKYFRREGLDISCNAQLSESESRKQLTEVSQKLANKNIGAGPMGHGGTCPPTFTSGWARGGTVSRRTAK